MEELVRIQSNINIETKRLNAHHIQVGTHQFIIILM